MNSKKDVRKVIENHIKKTRMLQIATCVSNQPWNCTVYFAYDENLNFYWISKPNTRHSREIMKNPKVACVIAYDQQPSSGKPVQGLSLEGKAQVLTGKEEEDACKFYSKQLNREKTLLHDIRSGKNPHKLYRFKPSKIVLFDRINFPDNERQEYTP